LNPQLTPKQLSAILDRLDRIEKLLNRLITAPRPKLRNLQAIEKAIIKLIETRWKNSQFPVELSEINQKFNRNSPKPLSEITESLTQQNKIDSLEKLSGSTIFIPAGKLQTLPDSSIAFLQEFNLAEKTIERLRKAYNEIKAKPLELTPAQKQKLIDEFLQNQKTLIKQNKTNNL